MKDDLALTATGTPAVVLGGERYPLVFTIAGMKEWAEHKGRTFEDILANGWLAQELSEEDLRVLLRIALTGGERRRALFNGGDKRVITDDLIDDIMAASHPTEIITTLVTVWNEPPVRPPDPQIPESAPAGE